MSGPTIEKHKGDATVRIIINEPHSYRRVRVFRGSPKDIERLCQEAGTFVFEWPTVLARSGLLPPKEKPSHIEEGRAP
jgi:hypothetical protein